MKRVNECVTLASGIKSEFSVNEMSKTFTLRSQNVFFCDVIAIDKCVFTGSSLRRCDYLFLAYSKLNKVDRFEESKAYFIELKGDNVRSACEQLYNAIDKTKNEIFNFQIEAKVIGTKGFQPDIRNNDYYRKVRKLIRKEIGFHKVHKGNSFNHVELI